MHALSGWHHVHGGKVYVCQLDYHGKRMNVCDIVEFEDGMIKADRGYFAEPFEASEWRTIAGVLPVAVWVALRAVLGLYPGYGINAVDELRRESYATLGALIIASTFLGLHQGQDVSRSVLIGGFLALLIAAPLVRQSVKWSLKKARLWGAG